MYNNYDYPAGADTPDAPWNEIEIPESDFKVSACQTLEKTVEVTTDNYCLYKDEENGSLVEDTENTDWKEVFEENEHFTPLQLIALFKRYLQNRLDGSIAVSDAKDYLEYIIDECNDWLEVETSFIED